jgi:hypothetical protein
MHQKIALSDIDIWLMNHIFLFPPSHAEDIDPDSSRQKPSGVDSKKENLANTKLCPHQSKS